MNNKFVFVALALVLSIVGLFVLISVLESSPTELNEAPYTSDNPQYVSVRKEIDQMKANGWDSPTYYRIKKSIQSYQDGKQMDNKMSTELEQLLTSKYLVLLKEAVEKHCQEQVDISSPKWKALQTELNAFAANAGLNNARILSDGYRTILSSVAETMQYSEEEEYNKERSEQLSAILAEIPSTLKTNSKLVSKTEEAISALGTLSGYANRFNKMSSGEDGGFATCICNESFRNNTYYQEICLDKQEQQ